MQRMPGDTGGTFTDNILWDVINSFVSIDHAGSEYGVVINPETMKIDRQASESLRGNSIIHRVST